MAIDSMYDPYTSCCFVSDNILYVQLFYAHEITHFHFLLNLQMKKIEGEIYSKVLPNVSKKNFPVKCFYNNEHHEIYSFYRQGEVFNSKLSFC